MSRILYFGNGARGVKCLEAVHEAGLDIIGVVVHGGMKDSSDPHSLAACARSLGLPLHDPKGVNSSEFVKVVRELKPDLKVLSGYTQILRKEILSVPPRGTINLHGGRLPDYRGASPIHWQIINGEESGGCAILYVDEGIDSGDILAQREYEIGPEATAGEIIARTLEIFPALLVDVLKDLAAGRARGVKQDREAGSYYCKRYPWDGEIDWKQMTDVQVHNLVRALHGPALPGAFTFLGKEKVVVLRSRLLEETVCGSPGRIALKRADGVVVLCANRGLLVQELEVNREAVPAGQQLKICGESFRV